MLRDLRVGLHLRNLSGCTPLQRVASNGFLGIIKCWIALGREMDLGTPGDENTDAILAIVSCLDVLLNFRATK